MNTRPGASDDLKQQTCIEEEHSTLSKLESPISPLPTFSPSPGLGPRPSIASVYAAATAINSNANTPANTNPNTPNTPNTTPNETAGGAPEDLTKDVPSKVLLASERFHKSIHNKGELSVNAQVDRVHGKKVAKRGNCLRMRLYVAFALMEAIMIAALLMVAYAGQRAVRQMYQESAVDTLGSVGAAYTKKVDQLMDILMALEFDSFVQEYLQSGTAYSREADVIALLRHASDSYEIEYLDILDTNFRILASSNIMRKGEYFNPENILTSAKNATNGDPCWTHGTISYADLKKEGPQLYRDRETGYEMALYNTHPLETKKSSLIRWAGMVVHTLDFATGLTLEDTPLAYLLAGDVINGKSSSSVLVAKVLSGSGGVYERSSQAGVEDWKQAGAYTSLNVKSPKGGDASVKHILAASLDPNFVIPLSISDQGYMEEYYAVGAVSSYATKEFGFATTRQLPDNAAAVPSVSQPVVLLTRSVDITAAINISVSAWCAVFILAMDFAALLLATYLFLSPLEKMGQKIRKGGAVSAEFVRGLANRTKFGVFVAVLLGMGLTMAVLFYDGFIGTLDDVARVRSSVEPGGQVLAWRRDIDRIARVTKLLQLSGIAESVRYMNDTTQVRASVTALQRLLVCEAMEYATVVDPNGKILFSANPASEPNHNGTFFNPSGIVSATFSTGSQYTIAGIVRWPELQLELPDLDMWRDNLLPSTGVSALHCVNTHQDCLIRWMSSPMWIGGTAAQMNGDKADAVLVIGDLVNSKTKIPETSNFIAGHGYSAVYFYNTTGHYQMANGLLRVEDGHLEADVEMPETAWLDQGRLNKHFVDDDQATISTYMMIRGKKHVVSARCTTRNTVIGSVGSLPYLVEWNGQASGGCWCFLIQSIPVESVIDPITDITRDGLYVFLAVCVLKLIVMGSLCLAAYVPFHKIVMNKLVQGNKSKRVNSPTNRVAQDTKPASPAASPRQTSRREVSRREVTQRRVQRGTLLVNTASKRIYIAPEANDNSVSNPKGL